MIVCIAVTGISNPVCYSTYVHTHYLVDAIAKVQRIYIKAKFIRADQPHASLLLPIYIYSHPSFFFFTFSFYSPSRSYSLHSIHNSATLVFLFFSLVIFCHLFPKEKKTFWLFYFFFFFLSLWSILVYVYIFRWCIFVLVETRQVSVKFASPY